MLVNARLYLSPSPPAPQAEPKMEKSILTMTAAELRIHADIFRRSLGDSRRVDANDQFNVLYLAILAELRELNERLSHQGWNPAP